MLQHIVTLIDCTTEVKSLDRFIDCSGLLLSPIALSHPQGGAFVVRPELTLLMPLEWHWFSTVVSLQSVTVVFRVRRRHLLFPRPG